MERIRRTVFWYYNIRENVVYRLQIKLFKLLRTNRSDNSGWARMDARVYVCVHKKIFNKKPGKPFVLLTANLPSEPARDFLPIANAPHHRHRFRAVCRPRIGNIIHKSKLRT